MSKLAEMVTINFGFSTGLNTLVCSAMAKVADTIRQDERLLESLKSSLVERVTDNFDLYYSVVEFEDGNRVPLPFFKSEIISEIAGDFSEEEKIRRDRAVSLVNKYLIKRPELRRSFEIAFSDVLG